jgi:TonB family protein
VRKNDRTEWRLVKKVAPAYPQEAVDAGIEGVVVVAGVVKTDGMLRDLHVVSGPAALHQAAIDAAAQYVYEPVMRGDELGEASTQVPVVFTLTGPAKVAPEVMAGRILDSFMPPYPPEAIKQGISGAVILHVLIGRQGEVKDVRVVSGREVLRATAVDAVKQWRYEPYKRNGVDVEVETDVEVQFSLIDR